MRQYSVPKLRPGLVEAMRVLREKNIVHRDLKPQNMLLHNYTGIGHPSAHDLTLKLADFGLARYLADDSLANSDPVLHGPGSG